MYEKFEKELNVLLENTKKKTPKPEDKARLEHYEMMLKIIASYVKEEAENNSTFRESLGLYWKSAARMFKFVIKKAEERAVEGCCVMADDEVYDFINYYYIILDDKDEYDKELAEKAEHERKAKEKAAKEKAQRDTARAKAKDELILSEGWESLSDSDKEKKIKEKTDEIVKKMQAAEKRKASAEKKKEEKKAPVATLSVSKEVVPNSDSDEEDLEALFASSNKDEEENLEELFSKSQSSVGEDNSAEKGLDGQISLFDIFGIKGGSENVDE